MNSEKLYKIILFVLIVLSFFSCSESGQEEAARISGKISVPQKYESNINGPVFVAVSKTDDIEAIENDPNTYIEAVAEVDMKNYSFDLSLEKTDIKYGDEVFLFAFADNDYSGWIPNPTRGDLVGVYTDQKRLKTMYKTDLETQPEIVLNRYHFGHDTTVTGIIDSYETGDVILIAYAGEFYSTDFSSINPDNVFGYKKIKNFNSAGSFSLRLLPYGLDIPATDIYVIGLLDKNSNSFPDEGDKIGFATKESSRNDIQPICVDRQVTNCGVIEFDIPVHNYSGDDSYIELKGLFNPPEEYGAGSPPVFTAAVKGNDIITAFQDINELNSDRFDFIEAGPGENDFNLKLSRKKFSPGDNIFLFALWDKNYESGLPTINEGDNVGVLINKDKFSYNPVLKPDKNVLRQESEGLSFNGEKGYFFDIDRIYYEHTSSVKLRLEQGGLSDEEFSDGKNILLAAVYETGEIGDDYKLEMDKVVGFTSVKLKTDGEFSVYYNLQIFPALTESIPVKTEEDILLKNICIFALLDENRNNKQDSGEKAGYFWKPYEILGFTIPNTYVPAKTSIPSDSKLILDKTVRFK